MKNIEYELRKENKDLLNQNCDLRIQIAKYKKFL